MTNKVRVGVVGTSWYADFMHLPALKSHPQAALVAICGRNRDRAEELAEKYNISQIFTDYQEMIDNGDLEAIVVATPDDLHYPIAMAALRAGLHVLCEKPLAQNLEQAQEMYTQAQVMKVKHMTYFTWRWFPPFYYLHQLISEGYLGQCYYSEFRYIGDYGRDSQYGWKWDQKRGLGILGDLGVHMIDLARWLVGEISDLSAHLPTYIERTGLDGQPLDSTNDSALLMVKFNESGHGVIHVNAVTHLGDRGQEFQIILYGENGTLEMSLNFKDGYEVRGAKQDENQIKPLPIPDEILNGIDANSPFMEQAGRLFTEQSVGSRLFIEAIINDQKVAPNFYDGLQAQKIIAAAIESDQNKKWVSIDQL